MDKVKYVNHLGETLDLRSAEIMSSYEALKSFVMSMSNNRLTSEGKTTALPVICLSLDAANKLINTLEKDSINNKYGKLYINDWYIRVMYQGMTPIMRTSDKVKVKLSFYAEDTIFTKETKYQLTAAETVSGDGLNFPFGFPFNFGADPIASSTITNGELLEADFILQIDKPAALVSVSIDANSYIIDEPINEGEIFTLNTFEKEVYKTTPYGKVSLLGSADDTSYIFKTITIGQHRVAWDGSFSLLLTLLEHRRTPVWI